MLAALRYGSFRWLFAAQVASGFGNFAFTVAIAALLVEEGAGAGTIGTVLAFDALGVVAFAVPAGVAADRFSRRGMCIAADLGRMVSVGTIAIIGTSGSTAVIAGLAFIGGMGQALFEPAYRGLLPRVLPDDMLQPGNALGALSSQLALFLGPAISGVVIAALGAAPALGMASAIFALSWLSMLRAHETIPAKPHESGTTTVIEEAAEGFRAMRARPWIAIVVGIAMIHLLVAIAPWDVLAPLIADDDYGDVAIYGWMLAAMGTGAIIGAVAASRIRPRLPGVVSLLMLIPFCVLLVALALAPPLPVLLVVLFFAGIGEATFDVLWTTALQRDVPDHLLSRVISIDFLGSLALLPIGLALTGPAVDAFSRDEVLIFGAVVAFVLLFPPMLSDQVRRFSSRPVGAAPETSGAAATQGASLRKPGI